MKVTFLVALNIDDISQIPTLAGDIEEDLTNKGYDVESVAPWARATLVPSISQQAASPDAQPSM